MSIQYSFLKDFIEKYCDFIGEIQEKYMELLANLSDSPEISERLFVQNILDISERGCILIGYLGNPGVSCISGDDDFEIISTGTLFLEIKLSHGGRPVGHIEDIIVHPKYRGKGLSCIIMEKLLSISKDRNCYKTILQCKPEISTIYEKCGFQKNGIEMVYRF